MTKSEILKTKIELAIKKIESLTENNRIEVHNLFIDVFNESLKLPEEEFINKHYYNSYKKLINSASETFKLELSSLLDEKDKVNIEDNFFQIKCSLILMLPERFTK